MKWPLNPAPAALDVTLSEASTVIVPLVPKLGFISNGTASLKSATAVLAETPEML